MRIIPLIALAIALAPGGQADRVDEYVRSQLKSRHLPGVSLAVVKDGRIVKAAGYGLASLELDAAATEQTVYEIGSISKQFAADAVLLPSRSPARSSNIVRTVICSKMASTGTANRCGRRSSPRTAA